VALISFAAFINFWVLDIGLILGGTWLSSAQPLTWLCFGIFMTSAGTAVGIWLKHPDVYNPQITWVRNGTSLVGVGLSALAFNIPTPLSTVLGWIGILITLLALERIWDSEAASDLERIEHRSRKIELAKLQTELDELRHQMEVLKKNDKRLRQLQTAAQIPRLLRAAVSGFVIRLRTRSADARTKPLSKAPAPTREEGAA
jgi:hypothetical protein